MRQSRALVVGTSGRHGHVAAEALHAAGLEVFRIADGWFPQVQPGERLDEMMSQVRDSALKAGRDPATIGMEGRIAIANANPGEWQAMTDAWRNAGATHLTINTMGKKLTPDQHIDMIRRYREVVD